MIEREIKRKNLRQSARTGHAGTYCVIDIDFLKKKLSSMTKC